MIFLRVKPYCQDCPDFNPVVEREERIVSPSDSIISSDKMIRICDTILYCKYEKRCCSMFNFLKKKDKEEKK